MAETIYDEGRDAFMHGIGLRKCPNTDEARREAWMPAIADQNK
jgi:hypothetical protein